MSTTDDQHIRRDALSRRMAAAARDLGDQLDPEATYTSACELAVLNVDGCEAASLTMSRGRREVETRGATGDLAYRGDQLQYELKEGPCLDAMWQQPTVYSPHLGQDDRWRRWGPRVVAETGMHSVLAFRLFSNKTTLGALNMYSSQPDAFNDDDHADGLAIAAHIAIAVVATQKLSNLDVALGSRTVIGQAVGILMERFHVSSDVAFTILGRVAASEEVKLREIAAELVDTGWLRGSNHPE